MKRWMIFVSLCMTLCLLSACSKDVSLELFKYKAEILSDKQYLGSMELQEGEEAGKEVVPTALHYTFAIQNTGKQTVGNWTESEALTFRWEPNESLVKVSEEVMGFNLFDVSEHGQAGYGHGESFVGIIQRDEISECVVYFIVGYEEASKEAPPLPSKDQLDKLQSHALEGTLVILQGKEEVARFDVSENEKK